MELLSEVAFLRNRLKDVSYSIREPNVTLFNDSNVWIRFSSTWPSNLGGKNSRFGNRIIVNERLHTFAQRTFLLASARE